MKEKTKVNMFGIWLRGNGGTAINVRTTGKPTVRIIASGNGDYADQQLPANISEQQAIAIAKKVTRIIDAGNYYHGVRIRTRGVTGRVMNTFNPLTTGCIAVKII